MHKNKTLTLILLAGLVSAFSTLMAADAPPSLPAIVPVPVPGWQAPAVGEHPRLLFRGADLPAIKARAKTPEGAKIVERLRATLGGGEAMPTVYNASVRAYEKQRDLPEGAFTISHMAGFGMLYQLTGDKKYAELGKQCFLKGKEGIRDRDNRYSQEHCDGQLRLGPSLAMTALGYDLCYNGWDEAFRKEVALYLQNYASKVRTAEPGKEKSDVTLSLESLVKSPRHGATSNHQGATLAGAGFTVLAIKGDPGTDDKLLDEYDAILQTRLATEIQKGFGPFAFFCEGQGPSQVAVNSALVPYLHALRVSAGRDYMAQSSMFQWMTLRWVMEVLADKEGRPYYPARHELMGITYGTEWMLANNGGMTNGGWFSQGFGVIPESYKPALHWTYNTFAAKTDAQQFDTRNYPHRAIFALVNWPIGQKPANPATVMPKAICDSLHGYYVIRNRWQDADDVVISMLAGIGSYRQQKGWRGMNETKVFGVGQQLKLAGIAGKHDFMETAADGSTVIRWPGEKDQPGAVFAVDFSRRAGVDAVIVCSHKVSEDANSYRTLARSVKLGDKNQNFNCITLTTGDTHPAIRKATGQAGATLGGLGISLIDNKIVFSNAEGIPSGLGEGAVAASTLKTLFVAPTVEEKDVVLPKDPSYAISFDDRFERDGQLFTPDGAGSKSACKLTEPYQILPGVIGDGIRFSGSGFGLVSSKTPGVDIGSKEGFSVSFWAKDTEQPSGAMLLLERDEKGPSFFQAGWKGGFQFWTGGSQLIYPVQFLADHWYHVCWVADAKKKRLSLWLDGKYTKDVAYEGGPGTSTKHLTIGNRMGQEDSPKGGILAITLSMDEIRLFKRPLTAGEVVALYREGATVLKDQDEGGNSPPTPIVESDKRSGLAPLAVKFDASQSTDPDNDPLTFEWTFSDGGTASGAKVSHTFEKMGRYTIDLLVKDGKGGISKSQKTVTVKNDPPVCLARINWPFKGNNQRTFAPGEYEFQATDSFDPEGLPLKCTWNLGTQTLTGAVVQTKLDKPGPQALTLLLDDGSGRTTTWRTIINVPTAEGLLPSEEPNVPTTAGLHYRYFHDIYGGKDILHERGAPCDVNTLIFRKRGTTSGLLPWNIRERMGGYGIEWAGYLSVPADGEYTFHTHCIGGFYLWIDSQYVGYNYFGFGSTNQFKDIKVKLQKGIHRLRANLYGAGGYNYGFSTLWSGPGFERQLIPNSALTRSLTRDEQIFAGQAKPVIGSDVQESWPESNQPLEGPAPVKIPVPGKLEVSVDGPAADGYARFSVKPPGGLQEPIEYRWHLGDGSIVEGLSAARQYPSGNFTVTVVAKDAAGRELSAFHLIKVAAATSDSIGFKFTLKGDMKPDYQWRANMFAGVVPQGFWNNVWADNKPVPTLDSRGKEVATRVEAVTVSRSAAITSVEPTDGNAQLASPAPVMEFPLAITDIPYERYDLICYYPGKATEEVKDSMVLKVAGQEKTLKTVNIPCDYIDRWIEETPEKPEGNYVVFRGLSGKTQTLDASPANKTKIMTRPYLSAIQIVNRPQTTSSPPP
ncbi:MAG: PKD domain-containing protein [Phycisphaerae bacterium]